MPKSYLSDEPGAQRAERNNFDPYLQTYRRIKALHDIGHNVEKIEIIILGGTWSFYPEAYQIWFIKQIFEAINDFGDGIDQTENIQVQTQQKIIPQNYDKNYLSRLEVSDEFIKNAEQITNETGSTYNREVTRIIKENRGKMIDDREKAVWSELEFEQKRNETNKCRNVGLVIETRPDKISPKEVIRIRRLGCTKTQIGFQSLNDEVLKKNRRGHDINATRYAIKLLRLAGFKIHGHWMANLYGSDPDLDIVDYNKMFLNADFRPDELKVYPCSILETAELVDYYKDGRWKPYNYQELLKVVSTVIADTPQYCRLTRVIRDIPSTDILDGNKLTNFREFAEKELEKLGIQKHDIRSREIKHKQVEKKDLELKIIKYKSSIGMEYFLQFVTGANEIAGFLRLSLPNYFETEDDLNSTNHYKIQAFEHPFLPELNYSAMIREVHVYGKAVSLGNSEDGKAQHLGLGKELIEKAKEICKNLGYQKLAVISAIGTREYYKKRGFELDNLYQLISLL
jgi:elongator complex protein 3